MTASSTYTVLSRAQAFLVACATLTFATAAAAQSGLSDRQQAAFDGILPELEIGLVEQGGETLRPLAPMLATCVVEEASRRQLNGFGDGEISNTDTDLLNEIMARPEVQGCVAQAAAQQG